MSARVKVDFLGRGWNFPILVAGQDIALAEGDDDIRQSIVIVLSTRKGERVMRPEFGCDIHELVFAPNNNSTVTLAGTYVIDALQKWEPRIEVENVNVAVNSADRARLDIEVAYRIVSSNSSQNLVFPFYLENS